MTEPEGFSWSKREAIVVKHVGAIAVYKNDDGDVVVRQEARTPGDGDAVVVVPIAHTWSLIGALTRELKGAFSATSPLG